MYVLGLSFGFHDSSVALLKNNQVLFASLEERFTRKKHDNSFPIHAIEHSLKKENIDISDVDKIIYYEDNLLKLDRILKYSTPDSLRQALDSWIYNDKINVPLLISKKLNIPIDKIEIINHHLSHAAAAYYLSGFDSASVVIIDAVGEYETISIYKGYNNKLTKMYSQVLPHSIGLFYSAFTSFLGFEVNDGEYKVMGMASYGKPIYIDKVLKTILDDGEINSFMINDEYFNFLHPDKLLFKEKFTELFGQSREMNSDFFVSLDEAKGKSRKNLVKNIYFADVAASLQKVTETLIKNLVRKSVMLTGSNNICMAGGVALNSVSNGKIRKKFTNLFIPPESGDGGSSLGAALYYCNKLDKIRSNREQDTVFWGREYSSREIISDIEKNIFKEKVEKYDTLTEFLNKVSDLLISQKVIGWFNGKCEWGPRALGARSIIADPRSDNIQLIINEKIK
jgi:carbamoyltransferase